MYEEDASQVVLSVALEQFGRAREQGDRMGKQRELQLDLFLMFCSFLKTLASRTNVGNY